MKKRFVGNIIKIVNIKIMLFILLINIYGVVYSLPLVSLEEDKKESTKVNLRESIQTIQTKNLAACAATPQRLGNGCITLNFQNIEVRILLQLLAKVSGMNFIISDAVKGNMTLHVSGVNWKQALDIILKANGLDFRRYGNVLLIKPMKDLVDSELQELEAKKKIAESAPLKSEIIHLSYANADDIAKLLKSGENSILTAHGQVGVDARTNSLWIREIASNLSEVKEFIHVLDIPSRQVLIEARIVHIDRRFTKDLGVRFGVTRPPHLSGTLEGATQAFNGVPPGFIGAAPGLVGIPPDVISNRLNFNLPAGVENPGSIAFALINIGKKNFVDLELTALENERHAETISSPRLITSNQKEALIQQGEEIPYLQSTSSGATSVEFKKAVLSLKITPQITPDNNVVLKIAVNQDTRGLQIPVNTAGQSSALLPPAINTREVQSQIFLRNGETIVIGGIYERNRVNEITRVPFFGRLPLVGNLFKNTHDEDHNAELIIFITPRIIDQACVY